LLETGLRRSVVVRRLLQQQRAFEAMEFGLVKTLAGFVREHQRFHEDCEA
jgi:hypothetical protein